MKEEDEEQVRIEACQNKKIELFLSAVAREESK